MHLIPVMVKNFGVLFHQVFLKKLSNMVSSKSNSSNAIYAVDGSPIVKDIYYNNQWRTIALTGLGAGGYSYFALDITNPTSPSHLFTVENDPFNKVVNFWDANGFLSQFGYRNGSIIPERDYRKLGEAWSTPRIVRLKVSGRDKWVAIFGAGFNSATNPEYGSAVYVMDLENEGKLLKAIDINDDIPRTSRSIVWGTGSNNTQTTWNLSFIGIVIL
jgi:Tfp pilus tip-associated adhesin PilY1